MDFDLVVVSPVAGFEIGARITDRDLVAAILADERHAHVVKVAREAAPEEIPAPAPEPAPEPAPGTVARVPFMITNAMRERLRALGKTDDEIRAMTPEQAHAALGG